MSNVNKMATFARFLHLKHALNKVAIDLTKEQKLALREEAKKNIIQKTIDILDVVRGSDELNNVVATALGRKASGKSFLQGQPARKSLNDVNAMVRTLDSVTLNIYNSLQNKTIDKMSIENIAQSYIYLSNIINSCLNTAGKDKIGNWVNQFKNVMDVYDGTYTSQFNYREKANLDERNRDAVVYAPFARVTKYLESVSDKVNGILSIIRKLFHSGALGDISLSEEAVEEYKKRGIIPEEATEKDIKLQTLMTQPNVIAKVIPFKKPMQWWSKDRFVQFAWKYVGLAPPPQGEREYDEYINSDENMKDLVRKLWHTGPITELWEARGNDDYYMQQAINSKFKKSILNAFAQIKAHVMAQKKEQEDKKEIQGPTGLSPNEERPTPFVEQPVKPIGSELEFEPGPESVRKSEREEMAPDTEVGTPTFTRLKELLGKTPIRKEFEKLPIPVKLKMIDMDMKKPGSIDKETIQYIFDATDEERKNGKGNTNWVDFASKLERI
jgi:hypothetical protein